MNDRKSKNKHIGIFIVYLFVVLFLFNINYFLPDLPLPEPVVNLGAAGLFLILSILVFLLTRNRKTEIIAEADTVAEPVRFEPGPDLEREAPLEAAEPMQGQPIEIDGIESIITEYQHILNLVNLFVLVLDENLTPIYINEYGKQILGKKFTNLEKLRLKDFLRGELVDDLLSGKNKDGKGFQVETKLSLSGGRVADFDASVSWIYNREGQIAGNVITFKDISKLKRVQLNLNNQINFSKQIFKTIPDSILITDMDLRIIFANEKAESILEGNESEDRKIYHYLSETALGNGFDEYLRQIIKKGITDKQINVENPFIGSHGFVDIEIVPLKSDQKTIGGLLLVRDISEWRALTEELRNLELFTRQIIDSSPYILISIDEQNQISIWNTKAEELFFIKSDQAIGKDLFDICPGLVNLKDEINEAKVIGEPLFISSREMVFKENNRYVFDVTLYPVSSVEKSIVLNLRDVSAMKELESSLLQAQKMGSLGVITSKIIHDLNNVLSGITGYTSIIEKKMDPESELMKYVRNLITSSERASDIIKQVLSYSKKEQMKVEEINVNELIEDSTKFLKLQIKQVDMDLNLTEETIKLTGNKTKLSQVFLNLLINANDAVKNVEEPRITIKTDIEVMDSAQMPDLRSQNILISIGDNGVGIDEKDQDKIFEPFFTTKPAGKGTGMGLSNVKDIITGFGGTVNVNSKPGFGTEFVLRIPCEVDSDTVSKGVESKEIDDNRELVLDGKVLLIDDEEIVRDIGTEFLELMGVDCITAVDGDDGIKKFDAHQSSVALVILDVEMPNTSGEKVFDILKEKVPGIKILIASGYSKSFLEKNVFKKPILHFIAKPFHLKDLKSKIIELIDAS